MQLRDLVVTYAAISPSLLATLPASPPNGYALGSSEPGRGGHSEVVDDTRCKIGTSPLMRL